MTGEPQTPAELGYHFPAEWESHSATWLSYPHNERSWPGKIHTIFPSYHRFIREITKGEDVHINVNDKFMQEDVRKALLESGIDMSRVFLHIHPTNDAWCRDHGPAFIVRPDTAEPKAVVNWEYNGWGGKYEAGLDNQIPLKVASLLGLPVFNPGIIMEGGSIECNGKGTLITTASCLLNPNRNPSLSQGQIEHYLMQYYGVERVIWLDEGIEGDDTDGHVDDLCRFTDSDTIVAMVEPDKKDANHPILEANLKKLKKMRLAGGKQPGIIELPMPDPLYYRNQRLPVSYANFYIANAGVMVPTFRCRQDDTALAVLSQCFRDRPVVGIDSVEIIWGLGSWHCLSQQEPATG